MVGPPTSPAPDADAPPGATPRAADAPAGKQHDTPAMQQVRRFKREHPGCVLFFRMGDFYEMFYEDAELAHRVLGVTLTQRTQGIPMAGVPYHSVENYLRRMIQAGYRVAVCDQLEDAAQAKGVVERGVTRVITPGTLTDESLLEESRENPLAAVQFHGEGRVSLAWAELSTGAFSMVSLDERTAADELARIGPSELLYCETATGEAPPRVAQLAQTVGCVLTGRPAWGFRQAEAVEALRKQYGVARLDGLGLDEGDAALGPASAVLHYLLETQRTTASGRLGHLQPPRPFARAEHLVIDQASLRSLEVERTLRTQQTDGALIGVMRGCVTAMGKRLLRHWLCYPLSRAEPIEARQRVVGSLMDDAKLARQLREALGPVHDVPRIAARLAVGRATPRDLVALGRSAQQLGVLRGLLSDRDSTRAYHDRLAEAAEPLAALASTLAQACVDEPPGHMRQGGLIRDGYDQTLDRTRRLQRDGNQYLASYQKQLIEATGIASLKVGYNKVFGYYIEVTAANRDKAPDTWTRKQTLKNAERYITPELKAHEGQVLSAETGAIAREQALFEQLCAAAQRQLGPLHAFAQAAAELDVLGCFAQVATKRRWTRPRIVDEPVLRIDAGRHPVLDELLGERFVPNDTRLGDAPGLDAPAGPGAADASAGAPDGAEGAAARVPPPGTLALITGPNMAGKSTYIRQTALIVLLAHTGACVPADATVVGLCDRIFTRVGASDELHAGQSTFMVEMTETANICHHATERSLVILDEIGRGTSTLDGLSLAWAIAEHLADRRVRCLFATHYHELTQLAEQLDNVTNLSVTVREWRDQVVFLHRIAPGATNRSYGIHVAQIAGLPEPVVARARELLGRLAVSHAGPAQPPAAPPPTAQLSLFTEYLPHPAIERLKAVELERLTPLEAFDLLRRLKAELDDEPDRNPQ